VAEELSGPQKKRLDFRLPPGTLRARGELSDLSLLNEYFSYGEWLRLEGQAGFHASGKVRDGALQPGSYARVSSERLSAEVLDYRVLGRGEVRGGLVEEAGEALGELEVRFEEIDIFRHGDELPLLHSPGLRLHASGRDLSDVASFSKMKVRAELEPAEVPDLGYLARSLSAGGGFHLTSGRGRLGGYLELADGRGSGEVELSAQGVVGDLGGVSVATDLTLHARLASDDPKSRKFRLTGSRLRLDDTLLLGLVRPQERSWWAELDLGETTVDLGESFSFEGQVEVALRDSLPLTELLGRKRKIIGWLGQRLAIQDLEGQVQVSLGAGRLDLEGLTVQGRHLRVRGDLHLAEGARPEGLFYVRFWGVSAGVRLDEGERHLRLFPRERWYDRQLEAESVPP
jgi:hypothetical protein